jgi:hypothetical protein
MELYLHAPDLINVRRFSYQRNTIIVVWMPEGEEVKIRNWQKIRRKSRQ